MKNKFLVVLCIAFMTANITNAQEQKFHFGLKVAPTVAWMKPDTKGLHSDGSKLGFTYGLVGENRFANNYSFTYGVQVTYRGGILKNDSVSISPRTSYVLKYVEVPIGIKMKTNEFNRYRYFGQFGLVPGLNLSAKGSNDVESNIESKAYITDINMSMLIAVGTEYTISGSTTFLASLEFNNGFVDVLTKSKDTDREYKAISNYVALNLGIMF
ncbi:MAG: porin family protein [Bacteroidota bacterium]